jgi:hypothetical protein
VDGTRGTVWLSAWNCSKLQTVKCGRQLLMWSDIWQIGSHLNNLLNCGISGQHKHLFQAGEGKESIGFPNLWFL